jgi:hypothetical protein
VSEPSTPWPGASRQRQRRAVVLAVATDAAIAALLVLLVTVLAGGLTAMTGWRRQAALAIFVLVATSLLARQVWRGRRAVAAAGTGPRSAAPPAAAEPRAGAIRVAAPIDAREPGAERFPGVARRPLNGHATSAPEEGKAARAPANGRGHGRPPAAGNLPEEIGASLLGIARREVRCDSAAVLVPDGGAWTVIADADLPDTNGTLRIPAARPLIDEVLHEDRPHLVNGWDRTPGDLGGLPLPASDHVLAVPLRQADSMILLSRAHPPFHREELLLLSRVLDLEGTMLDLALKMRKLREDLHEAFEGPGEFPGLRPREEDPPTGRPGRADGEGRR